jgi:serine/threonine protein kinase
MRVGSFSVILNPSEYIKQNIVFPIDNDGNSENDENSILYKITQIKNSHNGEELYSDFFNKNNNYLARIYKDTIKEIDKNDKLITYIKEDIDKYDYYDINGIFKNNILTDYKLVGYFVEDVGNYDLHDTLSQLIDLEHNIWSVNTLNKLNDFVYNMCKCLEYLESNNMGHFDIKPENIVYNNTKTYGLKFKLIDFGFADKYPFDKFTSKLYGSQDYVPFYSNKVKYSPWRINNRPNDWFYNYIKKKYCHYISKQYIPELVYKSDVYSMGTVFNQILYYIEDHFNRLNIPMIDIMHIRILIEHMTHENINLRYNSKKCIKYLGEEVESSNNLEESALSDEEYNQKNCLNCLKCLKN